MRIQDNNGIETIKKRQRLAFLKLECQIGNHEWGLSASPEYEKCVRSWCFVARKIDKANDNSRGKAEMDTGNPLSS